MDPIAIILTIAACIAGLSILAAAAWGIIASLMFKSAKKSLSL